MQILLQLENKDISLVYRDIKVSSNNLNIFGTIGRNAFVNSNNIDFSQTADVTEESTTVATQGMINGNFEYTAKNEMTIPDGVVTGEVKYTQANTGNNSGIQSYLISLGTILATVILVWLVSLWLTPKFAKNTDLINKKSILPQIGLGILTPIVLVIVSIILVLIGITAPFGLLVLGLTFLLIAISTSVFIIAINNMICNKLKIQKTIGIFGMLIVTAAVLWLIGLIPYVGGIEYGTRDSLLKTNYSRDGIISANTITSSSSIEGNLSLGPLNGGIAFSTDGGVGSSIGVGFNNVSGNLGVMFTEDFRIEVEISGSLESNYDDNVSYVEELYFNGSISTAVPVAIVFSMMGVPGLALLFA